MDWAGGSGGSGHVESVQVIRNIERTVELGRE